MHKGENIVIAATFGLLPNYVAASWYEDLQLEVLRNTSSVQVYVSDQVSGGCWTNSGVAKAAVERELLNANVPVAENAPVKINIRADGYRVEQGGYPLACVISLNMSSYYYSSALAPNNEEMSRSAMIEFFSRRDTLTQTGKDNLNNPVSQEVRDWATEFVVLWLKARQKQ